MRCRDAPRERVGGFRRSTGARTAPACNTRDGADSRGAPIRHARWSSVRGRDGPRLRGDRVRGTDATDAVAKPCVRMSVEEVARRTWRRRPARLVSMKLSERPCDTSARALFALRIPKRVRVRRIPRIDRKHGPSREICLRGARGGWQRHGARSRAPWDRTRRRGSASTEERDPCRCDECPWIEFPQIEALAPDTAPALAWSPSSRMTCGMAVDSRPRARDSCAIRRLPSGFPLRALRITGLRGRARARRG